MPSRKLRRLPLAALLLLATSCHRGQRYEDFTTRTPLPTGHYLVLGFVGGRQPWNSESEGVRKLALKLRTMDLPGVHVETVENRRRDLALQLIYRALDRDGDARLDEEEKRSVRIILYGQSFGGAAVVKLAGQLQKQGVPVGLTVQVDSVGRGDAVIPANVERAANLYQRDGIFIRGQPNIRAEDPGRTEILGNFRFDYRKKNIDLSEVPWQRKVLRQAHSKMNLDPEVWSMVEELILGEVHLITRKTGPP